ncbi:MAG TPA: hypothetical protein VMV74_03715, partial [Bacteroidales bacterium]|nr:hypothetical protein [Bacteroidales bacterium]
MNRILLSVVLVVLAVISSCKVENKPAAADLNTFRFQEYSIDQLQEGYRNGEFTVTEVVQAYLDRINAIDDNGPK